MVETLQQDRGWLLQQMRGGRFFRVTFIKRGNGEVRRLIGRIGVRKHLRGGQMSYIAADKDLITVFDIEKMGYRSVPVDGVISLRAHGQEWRAA